MTATRSIDAVLPLVARDLERATILFDSLWRLRDLGTLWLVVPDDELAELGGQVSDRRARLLGESAVVPELRLYRGLQLLKSRGRSSISGWYVQQLVKMAMAERVQSSFYLTLDADVICIKTVGYDDLIRDGRGINQRTTENRHPKWYERAAEVLEVPRSRFNYGVTPALLSRDAMMRLHDFLARRVTTVARAVGRWLPGGTRALVDGWRSYLLRNLPWTEYALYGTFLEAHSLYERYHWDGGAAALYERSVWTPEDFRLWDPRALLEVPNSYFCVVQSTTKVAPAAIRARLESLPR